MPPESDLSRSSSYWGSIVGQPFVTVSPVGTSSGYPTNNGANYGPDTPGTVSSGLFEALNALQTIGGVIFLLPGTFKIAGTATIPNITHSIVIMGSGMYTSIIQRADTSGNSLMTLVQNASSPLEPAIAFLDVGFDMNNKAGTMINVFVGGSGTSFAPVTFDRFLVIGKGSSSGSFLYVNGGAGYVGGRLLMKDFLIPSMAGGDFADVGQMRDFAIEDGLIYSATSSPLFVLYPGSLNMTARNVRLINTSTSGANALFSVWFSANNQAYGTISLTDCEVIDGSYLLILDSPGSTEFTGCTINRILIRGGSISGLSGGIFRVTNTVPTYSIAIRDVYGYNPQAASGPTSAGTSPYTWPLLPYDANYVLVAQNGQSALSLDGKPIAFTLAAPVFVAAGHTLISTWSGTAPTYDILPI